MSAMSNIFTQVEMLYDALRERERTRWGDSNDAEIEALQDALDIAVGLLGDAHLVDPGLVDAIGNSDAEDFDDTPD